VYKALNWAHEVYIGATMASERTAAQYGKLGEVRRDPMAMLPFCGDPMAMLPFCGYNMADYFEHWLRMGVRMHKPPHIFHVNWFRQDEEGNYLWPGFGDNLRVLEWILARCNNEVDAQKTAIGWVPKPEDLPMEGLDLPKKDLKKLLEVKKEDWMEDEKNIKAFLDKFGPRIPLELRAKHEGLLRRLDVLG